MRLLAIGDIHGCLTAFDTLLEVVAPQADDRIIALGDYIDRGPDSRGVLDRLIALFDEGRLVPLRGNHDAMMLEARGGHVLTWLLCGGKQTLSSYGIAVEQIRAAGERGFADADELFAPIPDRHWAFLEKDCRPWYEAEHHFFVHAYADPDVPLAQQREDTLYWQKLIEPCVHVSGKTMICGHTRQKNGLPLDWKTTICIDTNIYDGGWLTCLDVLSGRVWQANERGKTRTSWLDSISDASTKRR